MRNSVPAALGGFLAVLTIAASASAQAPGVGENDVVRFTRTMPQIAGKEGVSVWLHRPPGGSAWQLRIIDRTQGKVVGTTKLPEWAGAEYYGYDVTVRGLGNVVVVIFEAAPAPGVEAPPTAESFQIAWAYGVRRNERKPVWVEVGSTRNSPLDGGDRLVLRKEDGKDTLVRLRTSAQTRFCGADLAAYQIFNPEEISFRSKVDLETLTRNSEQLQVDPDGLQDEEFRYPRFALWYSATSDRYNADDSRTVIRPLEVGDGDTKTAWVEGAPSLGRGQFLTARVNDALKMRGLWIAPGHLGSEVDFTAHAKPRRILISLEDGSRFAAEMPAMTHAAAVEKKGHVVWFPRPVRSQCMSVILVDSVKGTTDDPVHAWKQSAVAISELAPISELYGLSPDVAALVVVEKLLKAEDVRNARRLVQLTSPLASDLVAVLQTVLQSGSDEDRQRVVPLLRSLPSESSVPVLVAMFESATPSEKVYMTLKPAIAAHRELAAPHLVEMLEKRPPKNERKYIDLTRLIGRLGGPEELNQLLKYLGDGTTRVRNERVRAISAGGDTLLSPLFKIAEEHVDEPRGLDALSAINSIGRKLYFRGQGEREGSGALLRIADRAQLRRTILMTMRALGYFYTEGSVELLADFAGYAPDPLLRKEAVEAIGRNPSREARVVLTEALLDESPDVRIAAISSIGRRDDKRQSLAQIQNYVSREQWTPGLEVGYTVLAELGDDKLVSEMATAIAQHPDSERAAIAAEALTRAKRTLPATLAESIMFADGTSLMMRRNLVDLLGVGDDTDAEGVLMRVITVPAPFPSLKPRQNDRIRQRAVLALGRRDTPTGRETLLALVGDGSATNDMRAVALRALAFSSQRELMTSLTKLRENAPVELHVAFDSAIELIGRRADIDEMRTNIEDVEKRATEESAVPPKDAPQ